MKAKRTLKERGMGYFLMAIDKLHSIFHPSKVFFQPRQVFVEPSKLCNLSCKQCARANLAKLRSLGNMSLEEFKRVVSQLPKLKKIHMYGLGEPLMNPELFKMVDHLKKTYKSIEVFITSNGTLLNKKICNDMIDHNVDNLNISLDAGKPETYKKIRGMDSFDKIIKNIKYLTKLKEEKKSDLVVSIAFVVQPDNWEEMEDFIRLGKESNVDYVRLQDINPAWLKEEDKKVIDSEEYARKIEDMKRIAKNIGIKLVHCRRPNLKKGKKRVCPSPFTRAVITWDGYVTPCCIILDQNMINFGNIFKEDLKDIFNNKKFVNFRKNISSDDKIPSFCKDCISVRIE